MATQGRFAPPQGQGQFGSPGAGAGQQASGQGYGAVDPSAQEDSSQQGAPNGMNGASQKGGRNAMAQAGAQPGQKEDEQAPAADEEEDDESKQVQKAGAGAPGFRREFKHDPHHGGLMAKFAEMAEHGFTDDHIHSLVHLGGWALATLAHHTGLTAGHAKKGKAGKV